MSSPIYRTGQVVLVPYTTLWPQKWMEKWPAIVQSTRDLMAVYPDADKSEYALVLLYGSDGRTRKVKHSDMHLLKGEESKDETIRKVLKHRSRKADKDELKKALELAFKDLKETKSDSSFRPIGTEEVGGCVKNKEEMIYAMMSMVMSEDIRKHNKSSYMGILLEGPPGTGKTITARACVSVAMRESGEKIWYKQVTRADLHDKYHGESEKKIQKVFQEAIENAPSVLFLDELDGLVPDRSRARDEHTQGIVAFMLTMVNMLAERPPEEPPVFLIAATNHRDHCDPAFIRQGRMDKRLQFGIPDESSRRDILNVAIKGTKCKVSRGILDRVVAETNGYTGANIVALVKDANWKAGARQNHDAIRRLARGAKATAAMKSQIRKVPQMEDVDMQNALNDMLANIPRRKTNEPYDRVSSVQYARSFRGAGSKRTSRKK